MELAVTLSASIDNPDVGDFFLGPDGDAVTHTTLAAEVAQRLTVRLNFFRGEWFLDQREGTPYYDVILTKGVPDAVIRSVFGQVITGTEGVVSLTSLEYSRDNATRRTSLTFEAPLEDGSTFRSTDFQPFVVLA